VGSPTVPIDRYTGCLIGTALGDSLLLPAEGLPRAVVARRFPGALRQRLVCGRGMISDDTEHAFLSAQAVLVAGGDAQRFAAALARRLRWWLLSLPGGIGRSTLLGLLRSWLGFPPDRSGVTPAPGNGPAMRSAILGLRFADDAERRRAFVAASAGITHRDARAVTGAMAVAEAAAWSVRAESDERLWDAWHGVGGEDWAATVALMKRRWDAGDAVDLVARDLGCGERVFGTAMHSVPVALYAWIRHRHDPEGCFAAILRCAGDTDTMGAIAGALLGIDDGPGIFPAAWSERLWAWPLGMRHVRLAGAALAATAVAAVGRPVRWSWWWQPARNLGFLVILIAHVVRRRLWPW